MPNSQNDSEALVEEYVKNDQTEKAVKLLFKMAIHSAKKKEFLQAETYRDRLYEIDSMALSSIVNVNEVIEQEKTKALTPGFRQLWAPFFKNLSAEEANAFFFAFKEQAFDSEQMVLQQGQPNDRLYLINRGQLKVIFSDQSREMLIQTMGRGDFFGQDTFFSVNVCTVSVKTLTEASLSYVDRRIFNNAKGPLTALEAKLKKICCSGRSTFDRLRQKGMDRRAFKRINFNAQVSFQLLSSKSHKAMQRSVKAELWDISKGGLSFYFQSKNREAIRQLIGRKVGVRLKLDDMDKPRVIAITGIVHGVEDHPLDEYSVHVKLVRNFSDAAIRTIHRIADQ